MIINSKWWENPDNVKLMVQYQCRQVLAALPDFGETEEGKNLVIQLAYSVEEPEEHHWVMVAALLQDLEAVICKCGECNGREWTNGTKLADHFVDLFSRGRSLNFVEPQEDEEAV